MSGRTRLRIVVLHNNDYAHLPPDDPGYSARADVENAAQGLADALVARGHHAERMGLDLPELPDVLEALHRDPPDVVFNLCESLRADARHESMVPALLDLVGAPYTGSGAITLGLALRKDRTKALLRARGVPTPEGFVVESRERLRDCKLTFPLIVKPTREDASVGISSSSVVNDPAALQAAVELVLDGLAQPALVERFVDGREIYVSLLGNRPPDALPLHEIDFSGMPEGLPRIVSYSGKWEVGSPEFAGTQPTRCLIDEQTRLRVVRAAREAFEALELQDYGRVDIRLGKDNVPYVIDVNPNCDLTDGAGFARAAGYGGLDYPTLVERVCLIALERHHHGNRHADAGALARAARAATAVDPAAARIRPRAARGADNAGRAVPSRGGEVRARAGRRRARQP